MSALNGYRTGAESTEGPSAKVKSIQTYTDEGLFRDTVSSIWDYCSLYPQGLNSDLTFETFWIPLKCSTRFIGRSRVGVSIVFCAGARAHVEVAKREKTV